MSKPDVLVFGKGGQIGIETVKQFSAFANVVALDRSDTKYCGDLEDSAGLKETIRAVRPNCIVNAAAFTAVDLAENEKDMAELINSEAVKVIADEAENINALLVHYSTDYVFDGSGEHYRDEESPAVPINEYGRSKLAGEKNIISSGCRHLIFRTSWVYSTTGSNFIKTILRLAKEKVRLNVVSDQFGAPTSAALITDVTAECVKKSLVNPNLTGIYNLVSCGETSWLGYARFIVMVASKLGCVTTLCPQDIVGTTTSQYQSVAPRPLNSRLSTAKIKRDFECVLPDWQEDVEGVIASLVLHEL